MTERRKLSDILGGDNGGDFRDKWNNTTAADDFKPLPPGNYVFRIVSGELFTSKRETPGYKLALEVTGGEHEGRRVWHDLWLTAPALPMAKRDLAKIGLTKPEQLEQPLPSGILIRGRLVIHRDDDGNEVNKLKYFEYVGIEPGDAFEPKIDEGNQGADFVPPTENAGQADAKPPQTNAAPAGELFPQDAANGGTSGFLAHERGAGR
ncbi:MAG TPA: hypothetical protein VEL76_01885 [Gemmataceae bacterium]|nr:hypothetical protein [Gemmataceae bacterium]